ncbi:TadE/TadG family type IV pilus assembly protein [Rhizobium oryzicola]|uniref:Pilus assembly protein n=1 Tax=Rhizobium oryzicola TaxID=1232668 RepID=A0ABT8SQ82_9HYPH|nr:TadE/TadG family type IV pilus assembly protein [Rhizobium oryzicola]MDO1580646.1 pilus assembly protein [Rhizobium oryzicola]
MMDKPHHAAGRLSGILIPLRRFWRDRSGIGGVEFAIIAPILIALYISCFELTLGISVAKRATKAAGSVADLVTQQPSVNKAYLATMVDVSKAIFVPYNTDASNISLRVTGVTIDANANPTVAWSWDKTGARPYGVGTPVSGVPADMKVANSFLIRTELSVPHELLLLLPGGVLSSQTKSITISRSYFFRQRVGDKIDCSDC